MTVPAQVLAALPDLDPATARPLSGGDTGRAWRVLTRRGQPVLVKATPQPGMAAAEAAGLEWLAAAGAATPTVIAHAGGWLALEWIDSAPPSPAAARAAGVALARLHGCAAAAFGCAPIGADGSRPASGWVGSVTMAYGAWDDFGTYLARARLAPVARQARAGGGLTAADAEAVSALCRSLERDPGLAGPAQQPVRIHGDLWSGNLLWRTDGAVLIDPAAHGGHPETDLAMLQLFGAPHLADFLVGYESVRPLARGWQHRVALHQVFPLLVHAVMFGGGYGARAARCARAALAT